MQLVRVTFKNKCYAAFQDGWRMFFIFTYSFSLSYYLYDCFSYQYAPISESLREKFSGVFVYNLVFSNLYWFIFLIPLFSISSFIQRIIYANFLKYQKPFWFFLFVFSIVYCALEVLCMFVFAKTSTIIYYTLNPTPFQERHYEDFFTISLVILYIALCLRVFIFFYIRYYLNKFNW